MALDSSIYGLVGRGVRSVADYDADAQRQEANALEILSGKRRMAAEDRAVADESALRQLVGGFGSDNAANAQSLFKAGRLKEGQAYQKANAELAKTNAEADEKLLKVANETSALSRKQLDFVNDPQSYAAWMTAQYSDPVLGKFLKTTGSLEDKLKQIPQDPEGFQRFKLQAAAGLEKFIELTRPKLETENLGGTSRTLARDPLTGKVTVTSEAAITQSADNAATQATSRANNQAQVGLGYSRLAEDKRQHENARNDANQSVTYITDPESGNLVAVPTKLAPGAAPVGRGAVGADGKPIMGKGGAAGGKVTDAKEAIALLDQAEGLIKTSTGSYTGKAIDAVGQAFGYATPGSISAQQLKALEGALVAKMPKMSGPQSDKDVALYRQMAAAIGDETIPYERKKAAMDTVREIQERYANLPAGSTKKGGDGGTARVANDADFNALPSGTLFVGPDGKTRRKP